MGASVLAEGAMRLITIWLSEAPIIATVNRHFPSPTSSWLVLKVTRL